MKNKLGLTPLRFKKFKELVKATLGRFYSINKMGDIRYGSNIFKYIFKPKFIHHLEFCINNLSTTYKVPVKSNYTIDTIIDIAYSNYILGEYNMSDLGVDFKFNTIRNVLKYHFKTKEYMINHYSGRLSIPIIQLLKKEFSEIDILNLVVPAKINIMAIVREFENGITNHIRQEFNLMRAGPYNIRSPLRVVA